MNHTELQHVQEHPDQAGKFAAILEAVREKGGEMVKGVRNNFYMFVGITALVAVPHITQAQSTPNTIRLTDNDTDGWQGDRLPGSGMTLVNQRLTVKCDIDLLSQAINNQVQIICRELTGKPLPNNANIIIRDGRNNVISVQNANKALMFSPDMKDGEIQTFFIEFKQNENTDQVGSFKAFERLPQIRCSYKIQNGIAYVNFDIEQYLSKVQYPLPKGPNQEDPLRIRVQKGKTQTQYTAESGFQDPDYNQAYFPNLEVPVSTIPIPQTSTNQKIIARTGAWTPHHSEYAECKKQRGNILDKIQHIFKKG